MDNVTPYAIWTFILAVASAIVLISNAVEKIVKAVKAAKAPNTKQDERLTALEAWKKIVDGKLDRDNDRLGVIEEGNRATQRAILALLDHGIDGNNIKQMQDAKDELNHWLAKK